jgi:hypothetical protein
MDYDVLQNCDCSGFDRLMPLLEFTYQKLDLSSFKKPDSFTFSGREYKTIQDNGQDIDPGIQTIGQKVMLTMGIREHSEAEQDVIDLIPLAAAVYLQPLTAVTVNGTDISKKFDKDKAEQLSKRFENLPVTTLYPVGNFFLTGFLRSLS